ncbi:MAG: YidC/Oxa1 family insertase periplasmic-domain containing protein [Acidobacteriota bacterium]
MDRIRILVAMLLATLVLVGWPVVMRYFYPPSPEELLPIEPAIEEQPAKSPAPDAKKTAPPVQPPIQATDAPLRAITVETSYWKIKFSNRGAVATSWILKKEKSGGIVRDIHAADGSELELIPKDSLDTAGAPLRLRAPAAPEIADQLNQTHFRVEGFEATSQDININLASGQSQEIVFTYSSGAVTARKAFRFHGDSFLFDCAIDVKTGGQTQPVELVLGPRFGDQSDHQKGTYGVPTQAVADTRADSTIRVMGAYITPPFAKIAAISQEQNQILIDKPLASDVDHIRILGGDGVTLLGYSRVVEREQGGIRLTLDRLPEGVSAGSQVAQGADTLRAGWRWAGLVDRYFAMVAVPSRPVDEIALTSVKVKHADREEPLDYPSVAVPAEYPFRIFVGPKDRALLTEVSQDTGANLDALIDYGIFSSIIRPLIPAIGWALNGLSAIFHNYGWAIVVVTVIINLALSPLRWYSSRKMKQAAKHQPRMKELQEQIKKLKDSPKKNEKLMLELQREQMALMKEANPLGGCLPMLLQMPVFWAFFIYLTVSLEVRQKEWIFWIKDLSSPDPLYILPIVMCVTMIASTWMMPQPNANDPNLKMQRIMMTWVMPIMLTWFFFFSAPSGLVLYWMVGNVVGVLIQIVINRKTAEPPQPETPTAGKGAAAKKAKGRRVVQQA